MAECLGEGLQVGQGDEFHQVGLGRKLGMNCGDQRGRVRSGGVRGGVGPGGTRWRVGSGERMVPTTSGGRDRSV